LEFGDKIQQGFDVKSVRVAQREIMCGITKLRRYRGLRILEEK